ncbi:helix-turn-helix transcriptional regulator [Treponema sp.]|uniref:helix-turn-helix domain-containing protein n=1 Tax=Treponema sp. TaxID=166 RepID=UPI0025D74515|nr:helix-turn-helix transcriptional regulator [Treponema sp.]MBR4322297.1 helix-turn-helix transcriptional regulator [Treponema sp.]
MKLKELFINNLKFYRKEKRMTQNELTLAIDKSYNYINSVEQGKMMPSFDVIEQICEVLQIKPVQLFDEQASPENIKAFNKEDYINGISEKLFDKLKTLISYEIRNTIG